MRLLFYVGVVLIWHRVQDGVPLSELLQYPLLLFHTGR